MKGEKAASLGVTADQPNLHMLLYSGPHVGLDKSNALGKNFKIRFA